MQRRGIWSCIQTANTTDGDFRAGPEANARARGCRRCAGRCAVPCASCASARTDADGHGGNARRSRVAYKDSLRTNSFAQPGPRRPRLSTVIASPPMTRLSCNRFRVCAHGVFFVGLIVSLGLPAALRARTAATEPTSAVIATPDTATITYRKIFKSSYPEFAEIKLNQSGHGTFDIRQLDEEPNPQPFEVNPALADRIFALASKLHNFQGVDLDIHRRIANLGEKTFRYDKGAEAHEVKFNYTLDDSASQLTAIFEGLARQTTDLSDLERTMRYDRLGVNDVLQQIEQDYNNKLFPEPERLLPALDQLAGDSKFIDIARQRARALASRIRSAH